MSLLLLLSACAEVPQTEEGDNFAVSTFSLEQENGIELNGMRLNGMRLNGMRLNGMRLNGMRLNGMRLNGSVLGGWLIVGVDSNGNDIEQWIEGEALLGTTIVGVLASNVEVPLRIDAIHRSNEKGNKDIWYYTVSILTTNVSGAITATPACGVDKKQHPIPAIAVPGVWDMTQGTATGGMHFNDPDMFTLGCADTAIGKCVEWGYKPWDTIKRCSGKKNCWYVSGADYHQACTRLTRADYCGDGTSSTDDGTPINVYDNVGIEDADTEQNWMLEAEWGTDGANCLNAKGQGRHDPMPSCATALMQKKCGKNWDDDSTLIMTDLLKPQKTN